MLIRDLFASDVTRDIPPVVYFHEQSPDKLAAEVSEYIVTGGWPEDHPNHRRVPQRHPRAVRQAADGHHRGARQARRPRAAQRLDLRLLRLRQVDLRQAARPRPSTASRCRTAARSRRRGCAATPRRSPASSARRGTPCASGSTRWRSSSTSGPSRATASTSTPRRSGRSSGASATAAEPLVADFELKPRARRRVDPFRGEGRRRYSAGRGPSVKDNALAEEDFSLVMSELYPDRYTDPMAWFTSRGGTHTRSESPEEAVAAIRDMLKFRRPDATLFLVIDEVSQYVLVLPGPRGPAARLRDGPRRRARGQGLAGGARAAEARRGGGRLLPRLGEGPLPARACASTSRRPTSGTSSTSGSCRSGPTPRSRSAPSSRRNRPDLKLYAYGCESVTPEEFVEVYPMLPGQVDLILQITTALRTRSARAQGDDQAIRGLLQLLGELFRDQQPRRPAGRRAGDPRPDLRGAAHRARRRRAGLAWPAC